MNCIWETILDEISAIDNKEGFLNKIITDFILNRKNYQDALAYLLNGSIKHHCYYDSNLEKLLSHAFANNNLLESSVLDLKAFMERDPACNNLFEAFLCYKGFKVLQLYRVANYYWYNNEPLLARLLQSMTSDVFSVDIHPAAQLSGGIFIDHATGIVIGETARIEKNVSILQNVTLGGTGKDSEDRHPKICEGVLIGAGATILGNIKIGKNSRIGAGSMVLKEVPENVTVVGIPAKIIKMNIDFIPAKEMKHLIEE